MAGANLVPSHTVVRFKPTPEQRELLLSLPFGERSAYIRRAIEAYMAHHPILTAIPLDERDTSVEADPIGFAPTDRIVDWLRPVPPFMRSYLIRHILRTYAKSEPIPTHCIQLEFPLAVNES